MNPKIVEDRFEQLELERHPVVVMEYATEDEVKVLTDALKEFDPGYDPKFCSKSQLRNMPLIEKFLSCPDHCRTTPFTFELRMCDKHGCNLCAKIKRSVCTPNVVVDGYNL